MPVKMWCCNHCDYRHSTYANVYMHEYNVHGVGKGCDNCRLWQWFDKEQKWRCLECHPYHTQGCEHFGRSLT